jgi:hypothetical protein
MLRGGSTDGPLWHGNSVIGAARQIHGVNHQ